MTEIIPEKFNTEQEPKPETPKEETILQHMAARTGLGTSSPRVIRPSVRTSQPELYRAFLNLEMADTQQERERLNSSLLKSVKKEPDPVVLERLANRTGLSLFERENLKNITLSKPPQEEGKKVFTDQQKWDQIIDQAPEEAKPISFKETFKKAREAGKETFEYKGNRFNTREKGETGEDWARYLEAKQIAQIAPKALTPITRQSTRRTQNLAAYRASLLTQPHQIPKEIKSTTGSFADFMKEYGVKVAEGKNVKTELINKNLGPALKTISPILKNANIAPEITSGKRGHGDWSLHEIGEAIDLRLKNATPEAITKLKNSFPGKPISVKIHGEKGQLWAMNGYEFIIHGEGDNIHLHVERDTKETKAALAKHLAQIGKRKNISRRGLQPYPELLKMYFPVAET